MILKQLEQREFTSLREAISGNKCEHQIETAARGFYPDLV
jgi:hypothetical protein